MIDDNEEDELRQMLLKSMVQKKVDAKLSQSSQEVTSNPQSLSVVSSSASLLKACAVPSNSISFTSGSKINRKVNQSSGRLVIQVDEPSSEDEDGDETKEPPGLSALLSNARQSANKSTSLVVIPSSIEKLSKDQQEEYLKLKKEIEKRQKHVAGAAPLLAQREQLFFQLKESLLNKKKEVQDLSKSLKNKKIQCQKANVHAMKMKELYEAAVRVVTQTRSELQDLETRITRTNQEIARDESLSIETEKECTRLGKEVEGASYVKPSSKMIQQQQKMLKERQQKLLKMVNERKKQESPLKATGHRKVVGSSLKRIFLKKNSESASPASTSVDKPSPKLAKRSLSKEKETAKKEIIKTTEEKVLSAQPRDVANVDIEERRQDIKKEEPSCSTPKKLKTKKDSRTPVVQYKSCIGHSLPSVRLSSYFEGLGLSATSDFFSNRIDPMKTFCYFDLHGVCRVKDCPDQHKADYLLNSTEKLLDIISYCPSLALVSQEDIERDPKAAKEKLMHFVIRFQKSQPSATFEELAHQLLRLVRDSLKDSNFLTVSGGIRLFEEKDKKHDTSQDQKPFKYAFNGEDVGDKQSRDGDS